MPQKTNLLSLSLLAAAMTLPVAAPAMAETGKVTQVEASDTARFMMDVTVTGSVNCPPGWWLTMRQADASGTTFGGTAADKVRTAQQIVLAAYLSGRNVTTSTVGQDTNTHSCFVKFINLAP